MKKEQGIANPFFCFLPFLPLKITHIFGEIETNSLLASPFVPEENERFVREVCEKGVWHTVWKSKSATATSLRTASSVSAARPCLRSSSGAREHSCTWRASADWLQLQRTRSRARPRCHAQFATRLMRMQCTCATAHIARDAFTCGAWSGALGTSWMLAHAWWPCSVQASALRVVRSSHQSSRRASARDREKGSSARHVTSWVEGFFIPQLYWIDQSLILY